LPGQNDDEEREEEVTGDALDHDCVLPGANSAFSVFQRSVLLRVPSETILSSGCHQNNWCRELVDQAEIHRKTLSIDPKEREDAARQITLAHDAYI